jgi:hypothetical protein
MRTTPGIAQERAHQELPVSGRGRRRPSGDEDHLTDEPSASISSTFLDDSFHRDDIYSPVTESKIAGIG